MRESGVATYRLRTVRHDPAVDTFALGRDLLRELVSDMTGEAVATVRITATCPDCGGPHGRPFVEGSALHIGLSHSATATVAVASRDAPVGVDVEEAATPPAAIAAIATLTGDASLLHWTRVEAVLKADGRGLRMDPASVVVTERDGRVEASIGACPERYLLSQPDVDADLVVSVATRL